MLNERIASLAKEYYPYALELRRHFHQHPELSFQEVETSARVVKELEAMGIPCEGGYGTPTNVRAVIRGNGEGPHILLRADMDALPVEEVSGYPYPSLNPGVMHACAHDGHTAGLLGAARILNQLRDQFPGTITLAFECAEENGGGSKAMIEKGILEDPKVEAAFGCHLWGTIPEGKAAFRCGNFMASCDTVTIRIHGRAGHASAPQLAIDPVVIASQFVSSAQAIVARVIGPTEIGLLTFGTIKGGEFFNIIPQTVELTGSIRNFNRDVRGRIHRVLEGLLDGLTKAYGATYEIEYSNFCPAVWNDKNLVPGVVSSVESILGKEGIEYFEDPQMGGETFSFFTEKVPSCFFFLGIGREDGHPDAGLHHNGHFCWDDRVLETYMRSLAQIALDYLTQQR